MMTGDKVTLRLHGFDLTGTYHRFGDNHRNVIELDEPVRLPSPPFQVTAADGLVRFFVVPDEFTRLIRGED